MEQIINLIDMQTLYTGIALIIFMTVNIVLGSLGSLFTQTFNNKILLQGIIKALIVIVCIMLIYIAGLLTVDIAAINISGQEVNVLTAIYMLIVYAFYHYVKEVINKLKNMLNSKIDIGDGM